MNNKKSTNQGKPQVNKELSGYEINISDFGEISSSLNIDAINSFLNKTVVDKKLKKG